jgi:hypothetical protein
MTMLFVYFCVIIVFQQLLYNTSRMNISNSCCCIAERMTTVASIVLKNLPLDYTHRTIEKLVGEQHIKEVKEILVHTGKRFAFVRVHSASTAHQMIEHIQRNGNGCHAELWTEQKSKESAERKLESVAKKGTFKSEALVLVKHLGKQMKWTDLKDALRVTEPFIAPVEYVAVHHWDGVVCGRIHCASKEDAQLLIWMLNGLPLTCDTRLELFLAPPAENVRPWNVTANTSPYDAALVSSILGRSASESWPDDTFVFDIPLFADGTRVGGPQSPAAIGPTPSGVRQQKLHGTFDDQDRRSVSSSRHSSRLVCVL